MCQEAYTLGVSRQLRGRKQDCIWHGHSKHLPKNEWPLNNSGAGEPSWLWHHAGSQTRKKPVDGGIKENVKTEGRSEKEVTAWETKPGSVKDRFSGL